MSDVDEVEVAAVVDEVNAVDEMNKLHVELARQAARLAMNVLENVDPSEIPVASAVALLKFGVELERKSLLGVEPDGVSDPFSSLAAALEGGQSAVSGDDSQKGDG